jgi:hypothetical protein
MKIGILTFHRGINAGGFLQAKGLSSWLASLGHEVELIDYMNDGQRQAEHDGIYRTRHPLRRWNNIRKLKRFQEAFKELPIGPKVSRGEEVPGLGYDEIVFGSDEIWNLFYQVDLTYFGAGMTGVVKSSYAPSFGSTPADHPRLDELVPLLSDFERITVRDQYSADLVERLIGGRPPLVVDPVFLAGPDDPIPHRKTEGAIGLYLMAPMPGDVAKIQAFARGRSEKICSIGYYYPWANRNIVGPMPGEIPGLLAGCGMVITNTFHGVVFSLKNRLPFVILDHPAKRQKINTFRERLSLATVWTEDEAMTDQHINRVDEHGRMIDDWVEQSKGVLLERFAT